MVADRPTEPVRLRPAPCEDDWDAAIRGRDGVVPFHSWAWLSWVAPCLGARFVPLLVERGGGQVVGAVPLLVRSRGPLRIVNAGAPFPYLGPLVDAADLEPALRALADWGRRHAVVDLQLTVHPTGALAGPAAAGAFARHGYTVSRDATYLHRLGGRPSGDLWRAVSRQRRAQIKRALSEGVEIVPATAEDVAAHVPELHRSTLAHQGIAPSYGDHFDAALRAWPSAVPSRSVLAVRQGTVLGAMVTLGGECALTWIGGVLPEHRASQAGALLYWDALTWARDQGCAWLDLVGIPTAAIGDYKSRFGGDRVEYVVARRFAPGIVRVRRHLERRHAR